MEWWGWLTIGVLSTLVVVLLIFLLRKKTVGLKESERAELVKVKADSLDRELKLEKSKNDALKAAFAEHKVKTAKLREWFDKEKKLIRKVSQDDFEKYLNDVDAAGDKFDSIVGISSDNSET